MSSDAVPSRYQLFNSQQTKLLCIAVKIDGVPDVLTSAPLYTRVRFGDPNIKYGDPGLVYGGLRPYTNADGTTGYQNLLSLQGSSTSLSQKLESESGRASISNITLAFVDKDGYMTNLFTPGAVVDEIMGRSAVMYVGYAETSFPGDYVQMFRGIVSGINVAVGLGTIQLSDANIKRKQELFFCSKSSLDQNLDAVQTTMQVPSGIVVSTPILKPDLTTDDSVTTYLKIDDEVIEYVSDGSSTLAITRGARGTSAATHSIGTDVSTAIQIEGSLIDLALKLMLSGWNGAWIDKIVPQSFGSYPDPDPSETQTSLIVLQSGVDAVRDYNLQPGDWLYFFAPMPFHPFIAKVVSIEDVYGDPNRGIVMDQTIGKGSSPGPWTFGIRSQYDVLPIDLGMKLTPADVDIDQHLFLESTFQSVSDAQYSFFLTDSEENGKEFIEQEIYRPFGLFSITKRGLLSVGMCHPPIADENLVILSEDNIINPQNIRPSRAINNRFFFNDVDFSLDIDDDGNYTQIYRTFDSDSLSEIGIFTPLSIESRGMRSATTGEASLDKISSFILSRFKRGMITFPISVQWGVGNLIEAGDTVAIQDGGALKIPNFFSTDRYFGVRLFEVLERTLDIPGGKVDLLVGAGVGADFTDRFATISPSTVVAAGSTVNRVAIQDSYGALYPGDEKRKWEQYIGEKVLFHSEDWTYTEETTLLGFDPTNPYVMLVQDLSSPPVSGYIVDITAYPSSADPNEGQIYKQVHAHLDSYIAVTSGTSTTTFSVSPSDASSFIAGRVCRVHNDDFTNDSGDVSIESVDLGTGEITLSTPIAFIPDNTMFVELGSFPDGGGPYRLF